MELLIYFLNLIKIIVVGLILIIGFGYLLIPYLLLREKTLKLKN